MYINLAYNYLCEQAHNFRKTTVYVYTFATVAGASHEISLFQFTESVAAVIPDKWRRVGLALGLTQTQLNAIDYQHRGEPIGMFAEVFSMWQQLATPDNNPVKWSTLVRVLKSRTVGEETLAESIQSKFIDNSS